MASHGDDGYPYVVPLNYVYWNRCIYIHCAHEGHKIDAVRRNPKVSFCVVEQDEVLPDTFETAYRSVIAFGNAFIVEDLEEKRDSIKALGNKYSPNNEESLEEEIDRFFEHTTMLRIEIDHLTGKQAKCLV